MIKCPNCGSTAQVQYKAERKDIYNNTIHEMYSCGCGCDFHRVVEVKDIIITSKPCQIDDIKGSHPYD